MKKLMIFMLVLLSTLFTTLSFGSDSFDKNTQSNAVTYDVIKEKNNEMIASLFSSAITNQINSNENLQVMSKENLADTKGGVTGPYICLECGVRHGGVYSPAFCQWCFVKIHK